MNKIFFSILFFTLHCVSLPPVQNEIPYAEMNRESIHIRVNGLTAHVRVNFIFHGDFSVPRRLAFPQSEWVVMKNFRAVWNGSELPVRSLTNSKMHYEFRGNSYPGLFAFSTTPADGFVHTHEVQYSYNMPDFAPSSKTYENQFHGRYLEYILVTGSPWKNSIAIIDAEIETNSECSKIKELNESFRGLCRNGIWNLQLNNSEPDKDINLVIED